MKNISTILSVLAILLSTVLLVLFFTGNKKAGKETVSNLPATVNDFKIAYFDIDSLQTHYEYFKDISEQIKQRENAVSNDLAGMQSRFQKKINEWRSKGEMMTQAEGEAAEKEYVKMQQDFELKQISLNQDLQKFKIDKMNDVRSRIEEFLNDFNNEKKYAFILSYEPGFILYYKDSAYDVTNEVINGLNTLYKEEKKN